MRWVPLVGLLGGMSGALADPAPRPSVDAVTWADWVGDWQGKLRWSGCTVDGEPAGSIAVDAIDGAFAIDLSDAGDALGRLPLAPDADGWGGHAGDVRVAVARGSGTLEVAVELDSGCAMHASLRRASIGVAACDDLTAWARIENRCTRLVKPPLENVARVAHQRIAWRKTSAEQRGQLAAQCRARANKVEAELEVTGCVPDPDPPPPPPFPECAALRTAAARLARCPAVPFELATSLAHDANALADATAGVESDTSRGAIEKQCSARRAELAKLAPGCL